MAVGNKPRPMIGGIVSKLVGIVSVLLVGMVKTPTTTAVNMYIGNIAASMGILLRVFLPKFR